VATGEIDLERIWDLPSEEGRKELMKMKGVGVKVADCVLLFAYQKTEVFPIDVWIKRAVEHYYFQGQERSLRELRDFAARFGVYAGFAQEYLYAYAREVEFEKRQK